MTQLPLFTPTVPSPLCSYQCGPRRCRKQGRAVYGPEEPRVGCVNRTIRCVTCGTYGEESRKVEAGGPTEGDVRP